MTKPVKVALGTGAKGDLQNGIDVPARGRISSSVREQFEAAQAS